MYLQLTPVGTDQTLQKLFKGPFVVKETVSKYLVKLFDHLLENLGQTGACNCKQIKTCSCMRAHTGNVLSDYTFSLEGPSSSNF